MKQPFAIYLTDTHISIDSIELSHSICNQAISYCKQYGVKNIFHGGDVFDKRKAQPLANLEAFRSILNELRKNNIQMTAIPGNHDKAQYNSESSYLDIFDDHPNLYVVRNYVSVYLEGLAFHFIPFFEEKNTFPKYLERCLQLLDKSYKNILITHIAINGVKNNDGTIIDQAISANAFKDFDSVIVGHYHNRSVVGGNIYYVGSTHQHDFGENLDKGFVLFYDDGSFEYLPCNAPKKITHYFNVNDCSLADIEQQIGEYEGNDTHLRVILTGPKDKLKVISTDKWKRKGVKVNKRADETVQAIEGAEANEFVSFTSKSIEQEFDAFAVANEFDQIEFAKQNYLIPIIKANEND